MDDYKELVQRLHRHIMGDDYFNINSDFASAVVQAADAIEQLAKERDAAIADLKGFCFCCKRHIDGICPTSARTTECDKLWEWRGVIE